MTTSRPAMRDERGFSLTEMLVASLVMMLVMGALYSGLEQTQVYYETYDAAMMLRQEARVALSKLTNDLRSAGYDIGDLDETVTLADGFNLQFVGDVDDGDEGGPCDGTYENASGGGAERITYSLTDDNALVRTTDCYDGTSWTLAVESSTLLDGMDPDLVLFQYFDVSGTLLPTDGGALADDVRGDVRSVLVTVAMANEEQTVSADGEGPEWYRISQTIRLINAENLGDL